MRTIVVALFLVLASGAFAEKIGREADIENDTLREFEALKGKVVILEGVAWGDGWPGLGRRVVLGTGARVYFSGAKIISNFPNGRLVRVQGRLTQKHRRAAEGIQAGYDRSFDYWTVEDATIEQIEKISTDGVEELPAKNKEEANQPLQRNASTGSVSNLKSPARRG